MENQQQFEHEEQFDEYEAYVARLPPGYRFVPEDIQLIDNYLRIIVENPEPGRVYGIHTVNLYASAPDELTAAHKAQCENNWYFFTKRYRKYANGNRPARDAGKGYWKQTNVIQPIFRECENEKPVLIGRKTTLDYNYKWNGVEYRTEWKMNEYRLDSENLPDDYSSAGNPAEFDEWCLCRVYKGRGSKAKKNKAQADLQVEAEPLQVDAEPNSGTMLIVPQEHNEHVAGELGANFIGQSTAAAFGNQQIIVQERYNGLNAGGPGPNSVQQSTNLQFSNDGFWNPNYSNYMANGASSSTNGMHYTTDDQLTEYQDSYPVTGTMYGNAGCVQPLRSLPPNGLPTWPNSNTNQSSSSIPDHLTSEWDFDFTFDDIGSGDQNP